MRRLCLVVFCLLSVLNGTVYPAQNANSPAPALQGQQDLNTLLMQSTFKIEGRAGTGSTIGTAFILGRPFKDNSAMAYVMVTAAHVLEGMQGDNAILHLRKLDKDNWVPLDLSLPIRVNNNPLWTKHQTADVAVMYVKLPVGIGIPLVSTNLLATDEILSKYEIHPGDELECLGYPLGFAANDAGFPILRSGKVASYPLLPTEKYQTFVLDFHVFEGNSGGPVYFVTVNRAYGGATHMGEMVHFIVGLVSEEAVFKQNISGPYLEETRKLQLGLAVIVQAPMIKQAVEMLPPPETTAQ